MGKAEQLRQLALKRKADRLAGYSCLADFHDGAYDLHDYVSPWTISARNVDAEVMFLLQDWSSENALNGDLDRDAARLGYTPALETNTSLIELVGSHFGMAIDETYVTNAFVFIKKGRLSARIPMRDMVYCAEHYALPQIEIAAPRLALCVGLNALNAIRAASGERRVRMADSLDHPTIIGSTVVLGVPHTGYWGTRNAGGKERVAQIWRRIATTRA